MKKLYYTALFAMAFFYGSLVSANTIAIDLSSTVNQRNNAPNTWTLGFSFIANTDLTVTELGYFDSNMDGLNESHEVGLFNSNGTLLSSGFVDATSSLDGNFRWTDVSDINLLMGGNV